MYLTELPVEEQTVYEGIIVNVRRDKAKLWNGKLVNREVIEHPGGVAVFALDEQKRVIMVRQFRYPMGETLLELPAGKLERGEDPKLCALRELEEETGFSPKRLLDLGVSYSSPGIFTEKIYLFLAQDLQEGEAHPDEDEYLDIVRVPLKTLLQMIAENQIADAKTIVGTMKAMMILDSEGLR